jgi:ParB-like chromosome segregation protein Spo0J
VAEFEGNTWVDPNDIPTAPPFSDLFTIKKQEAESITASMREYGFDAAYPLVVWRQTNLLICGHTRRQCAIEAGIADVPVLFRDFADESEALDYAIKDQVHRRQLTNAEIFRAVKAKDRRLPQGDRRSPVFRASIDAQKKTAAETAQLVGTFPSMVERIRYILASGNREIISAVETGKISVIKGVNRLQQIKKEKRSQSKTTSPAPATPAPTPSAPTPTEPAPPVATPPQPAQESTPEPRPTPTPAPAPQCTPVPTPTPAPDPAPAVPSDEEWLASFPLRSKVVTSRFDDDARVYRVVAPVLARLKAEIEAAIGGRSPVGMAHIHRNLRPLLELTPVEYWMLCPKCEGDLARRGSCKRCAGFGYVIPGL